MCAQSSLGPTLPIKLTLKGWTGLLVGPQLVDVRVERARREVHCRRKDPKRGGSPRPKGCEEKDDLESQPETGRNPLLILSC